MFHFDSSVKLVEQYKHRTKENKDTKAVPIVEFRGDGWNMNYY